MKLIHILILLFILSALAVGSSLSNSGLDNLDIINSTNISNQVNLVVPENASSFTVTVFNIIGAYVKFVIVFGIEVMKAGVSFGYDNPQYLEPQFIIAIIKLIIWATIIFLLIKPLSYLVILFILLAIWIKDIYGKKTTTPNK